MNKMKRIFSFVLVFAMLVGSFSSFSTVAFAEEVKAEEAKEEVKEEAKEEAKPAETKKDDTEVLSSVPKDVIGTEYEDAVTRLVAFGVIGGYPDGTYKPEDNINRAQFAKIVVVALGLDDAVPAAANKATGFSDVQPGYWAAGYINVASGQSLLKGYPDGTFKPANKVSYAEALTILVRALGYQDEFLQGTWPGNYVAKAADVNITTGVKLPAAAEEGAKRGTVAQLVNNTFDAKVVKVDTYKPNVSEVEYYETDIPLLKDKLEISKYEDTRIIADKIVDDGLEEDELTVKFLKEINKEDKRGKYSRGEVVKRSYNEGDTDKYRFESEFGQPRPVIGEEVTTYINDDDKVVYIERENDDRAHFDYVKELDGDKLDLVAFDKAYDFQISKDDELTATVYVFNSKDDEFELYNTEKDLKELDRKELVGRMGKVVVRNNKIVYAEILDPQEASPFLVVMKNNDGQLEGINDRTEDFKLDLRKDKDYDNTLVFNTKGQKLSVKDIKEGNVLYVQQQNYDGDDVAVVTVVQDNKVEGEMGRVKTDKIEIAGKEYKVVNYKDAKNKNDKVFDARYAINDIEDIKEWLDSDWEDDMEDAYKENVVAYKDGVGRIAFLTTEGAGTAGYKYGIITRTYADGDRVRIYTTIDGKEGKDQIFKADKERDIDNPYVLSVKDAKETDTRYSESDIKDEQSLLGSAVKFRLNSDGEIQDGKFFVMPAKNVLTMSDDFGKDVVKTNENGTYAVNSDAAIIIDAETAPINPNYKGEKENNLDGMTVSYKYGKETVEWDVDIDDFNIATWKDIKEDNKEDDVRFFIFPKSNDKLKEVDGMVFVGKEGANTGSDEIAVYVLDQWKSGDKLKVEYVSYENNEKQTREVDNEDKLTIGDKEVKKETAYAAKEKSNGKIALYGKLREKETKTKDFVVYRDVKVKSVRGNYITTDLKGNNEFLTSGALIYDEDRTKSVSALKGATVDLVVDGIRARVVGIVDTDGSVSGGDTDGQELGKNDYVSQSKEFKLDGDRYVTLTINGKDQDVQLQEGVDAIEKGYVIKDAQVKEVRGVYVLVDYKEIVKPVKSIKLDNTEVELADKDATEEVVIEEIKDIAGKDLLTDKEDTVSIDESVEVKAVSADEKIATVTIDKTANEKLTITAIAAGETTVKVTASTNDGSKATAEIKVTVLDPNAEVKAAIGKAVEALDGQTIKHANGQEVKAVEEFLAGKLTANEMKLVKVTVTTEDEKTVVKVEAKSSVEGVDPVEANVTLEEKAD